MIKKIFSICGVNFKVETPFEYNLGDNFIDFVIDNNENYDVVYKFEKKDEFLKYHTNKVFTEEQNSVFIENNKIYKEFREFRREKPHGLIVQDIDKLNESTCYYYINEDNYFTKAIHVFKFIQLEQSLSLFNTFILHSSQIKYKDKCIIFTAPSGTGKSTQARLWEKYEDAEIINGDRSGVRNIENKWFSYGLPFSGEDNIFKNNSTEIGAIVVIRQGNENKVKKLSSRDAFKYIYSETTLSFWYERFTTPVVDTILKLVQEIPVYMLECTPDENAVYTLKNMLEWGNVKC